VGLPEVAQPAGPRQQAVLHPRQADGPRLRHREDQGLRHGQVPQGAPQLEIYPRYCRMYVILPLLPAPPSSVLCGGEGGGKGGFSVPSL
jgi:hypothetical protein